MGNELYGTFKIDENSPKIYIYIFEYIYLIAHATVRFFNPCFLSSNRARRTAELYIWRQFKKKKKKRNKNSKRRIKNPFELNKRNQEIKIRKRIRGMGWEASEEKEKMSVQRQEEEMHTWEREGKKMQDEFEERIWFFDDNDGGRCVEERERKKKEKNRKKKVIK